MKQKILIAGSGKMAWNIGEFFLGNGFSVHWVTGSSEQQAALTRKITKVRRRMAAFCPEKPGPIDAGCHLLSAGELPAPDIIIEATTESLSKKKEVLAALSPLCTRRTLVFSTSSSLLPQAIHPGCLGAHFFYPVQMTACVELILPASCGEGRREQSLRFFQDNGLDVIDENEHTAFLVNRLLIPLQTACLRALREGYPAAVVDEASRSEMIGIGQLSLMESIGFDLLHTAACNYRSLPAPGAGGADPEALLTELAGRTAGSLSRPGREVSRQEKRRLHAHLRHTLLQTCRQEYVSAHITLDQLRIVCERIFLAKEFPQHLFSGQAVQDADLKYE